MFSHIFEHDDNSNYNDNKNLMMMIKIMRLTIVIAIMMIIIKIMTIVIAIMMIIMKLIMIMIMIIIAIYCTHGTAPARALFFHSQLRMTRIGRGLKHVSPTPSRAWCHSVSGCVEAGS